MGAHEFYDHAAQRLNYEPVFLVAELALFRELAQDAAVQLVSHATNATPGHVLFHHVAALLDFMHEAGKRGGAPDAALFQHADEGRLRVVRLEVANVHAGLQFVVFDYRVGCNGLKKRPAVCCVIGVGLRRNNAPARKLGAFHGVPVLALLGCRDARHQGLPRARRHAAFGRVPPNHAVQALLLC